MKVVESKSRKVQPLSWLRSLTLASRVSRLRSPNLDKRRSLVKMKNIEALLPSLAAERQKRTMEQSVTNLTSQTSTSISVTQTVIKMYPSNSLKKLSNICSTSRRRTFSKSTWSKTMSRHLRRSRRRVQPQSRLSRRRLAKLTRTLRCWSSRRGSVRRSISTTWMCWIHRSRTRVTVSFQDRNQE